MVINQKRLRKVFAFGLLGLYAFGVGLVYNYKTNCEYIRYLQANAENLRLSTISQNSVYDVFNSIDPLTTSYVNENNDDVVPFISYSIGYRADGNYTVGEVHFNFVEQVDLDHYFDTIYTDYNGTYASYNVSFMDVADFEFNNQEYDIVRFLTTLSPDANYGYNIVYQYGFGGSIDYDLSTSRLNVTFHFAFKTPDNTSWNTCSLFNFTYSNFTYLKEDVSYSFTNYTYSNNVLASNLNYASNSLNGYTNGINAVINDPSSYGLYTLDQYLAYGTSKYNEGVEAGSNVLSLAGVMNSIFSAPITMFMQIFNSAPFTWIMPTGEILDIGGIMTFFLTIGIALAIVKLIMRVGGK